MEVESDIPAAAANAIQSNVGLIIEPEFRNFVYRENTIERENWEIALGSSQVKLFERILQSVYGDVSVESSIANVGNFELALTPKLTDMQLATPGETGFAFFEAWLNYAVTIQRDDQSNPRVTTITAYGKENKTRFQRLQQGLNEAIENALRDAGAKLTILLTSKQKESAPPGG